MLQGLQTDVTNCLFTQRDIHPQRVRRGDGQTGITDLLLLLASLIAP